MLSSTIYSSERFLTITNETAAIIKEAYLCYDNLCYNLQSPDIQDSHTLFFAYLGVGCICELIERSHFMVTGSLALSNLRNVT